MPPFYISSWNLLCFTLTLTLLRGIEGLSCWNYQKCYRASHGDCVGCDKFTGCFEGNCKGMVNGWHPARPSSVCNGFPSKRCCVLERSAYVGYSYHAHKTCVNTGTAYTPCNAVCKLQSSCAPGTFFATDGRCTGNSFCDKDGTCKSCAIGTYQNEAGQTECKDCIACSTGQHQISGCTTANRI